MNRSFFKPNEVKEATGEEVSSKMCGVKSHAPHVCPSEILNRISNSLILLLESMDKRSMEYDTVELIAEYSYDKAKQVKEDFTTYDA